MLVCVLITQIHWNRQQKKATQRNEWRWISAVKERKKEESRKKKARKKEMCERNLQGLGLMLLKKYTILMHQLVQLSLCFPASLPLFQTYSPWLNHPRVTGRMCCSLQHSGLKKKESSTYAWTAKRIPWYQVNPRYRIGVSLLEMSELLIVCSSL